MSKKTRTSGALSLRRESQTSDASAGPAMLEALEPRLLLSLVAHLELNETSGSTAADTVGNHDGTLYGDTAWSDGRVDNGAYFDGSNDNIQLANSNDFDFGASTSFTVSAWVRDDGSERYAIALSRGNDQPYWDTSDGPGWAIGHHEYTQGKFWFRLTDGTDSVAYATSQAYDPSLYHLLTMVVDRSASTMYCYVDGALAGSAGISSIDSISSTGEALTLGEGHHDWEGMIDDVRVYDEALSSNDIESLYTSAPTWAMIRAEDPMATEDASPADTAVFRVFRQGSTSGALTVNYSVSGTASGADYSETLGGTVTIADGESYADITVTPVIDGADNGETLILTLSAGGGYETGELDEATAKIYDTGQMLVHLELDETSGSTADDSAGDHDGTLYGNTTWDDGRIDNGAYFDGSGDYVELDNSDDLNFGAYQSFTVSAWVRDDSNDRYTVAVSRGNDQPVWDTASGPGWAIGHHEYTQGRFWFRVTDGADSASYAVTQDYDPACYHLLTMVVDRNASTMYCYVDGALDGSVSISSIGSVSSPGEALTLGQGINDWEGMIDDVRVYNEALSSNDVASLYSGTDTWVIVRADDAIATEDAPSTDTATFRIYRQGSTSGALTVNYSVSGTAAAGDYSETLGGTVTIADGESYADITVTPVVDSADDGETLILTLTSGAGYDVSPIDSATVVFYDDGKLLAHLALDESSGSTAADSTGNGFTGTVTGATWTTGQLGNAAAFDGNADYITVANPDSIDFGGSQSFTVSAWVKQNSTAWNSVILSKGNYLVAGGSSEYTAGWSMGNRSPGSFSFGVSDGSTRVSDYVGGYSDENFYLVTMVVDRYAQKLYGYVNDSLVVEEDISGLGSLASHEDPLYTSHFYRSWKGIIDDVRIYTYALDSTAIGDLYAAAFPVAQVAAVDATAYESDGDAAAFRVYRDNTSGDLEVAYTVTGTAGSGDYSETLSGTVTIADGASYADITITPVSDAADDGETVILTLGSGTGYSVGDNDSATVTIYDDDALMMHLKLDETSGSTAADATGNGHTGTLNGNAVWDDGRVDNGVALDGSGDYIEVTDANDFDFDASTSFTVSAWVKDDGAGRFAVAVSRGNDQPYWDTAAGPGWTIGHQEYSTGKLWFRVTDGSAKVNYATSQIYDPTMFHLVTMVIDRSAATMYCYVDGELDGSISIATIGSISSPDEPLRIGKGSSDWDGAVDDVRVYGRALSADDVEALYNNAPAWVSIAVTDIIAIEDDGDTAGFRVYRDGATCGDLVVSYSISGTASSADYSESLSGTVTITDGESYADIAVTPVVDAADNAEALTLTVASGTGYVVGELDSATATIYDTGQLLMRLDLDETSGSTADDSIGDHDGTRIGGTVWDDGRIDNGAYFDGSGDRVDVANSDDFNFGASQSFTVSAWVRDDNVSTATVAAVGNGIGSTIVWGQITEGRGWAMGRYQNSSQFVFGVCDGVHSAISGSYTPLYADGYHLLTMVIDRASQQMLCYVDGVEVRTADISSIGDINSAPSELLQLSGTANWKGMIDDVRVYNYALSGDDVTTLSADAPTWVMVYAEDSIASEEAVGGDSGNFHIYRTGSTGSAVTVNYSVSGTASGGDYSETLGGTVTLAAGETSVDVTVTPISDGTADDGETVTLTLAAGTGYDVSDIDSGTITLYDEAGLLAHWKLDETSGSTAADATGNGFTGTRVGNTGWDYGRVGNGAYFDGSGDYITVANSGNLDFGGEQDFTVSVWVRDDAATYNRGIVSKGNYEAYRGYTTWGAGWSIGKSGLNTFKFGVTDGLTAVVGQTASCGNGYHLLTMTVDRGAGFVRGYVDGEAVYSADISSLGSLGSFDELLMISAPSALTGMLDDVRVYTYALTTDEVAELYDARPPMVFIEALDATAGETGPATGIFRIAREGSTVEALEVDYSISGTAVGADYSETLSGTVTLAVGESYTDIVITPVDDASNEGDETIIATLTAAPDDYAILDDAGTTTVTIGDNDDVSDPEVVITAVDYEATEDGSDPGTFRIYRSGATTSDLAVNYTVSGTAEGDDYSETLSGTVTITSGNSYADITITPVEDTNFEYPETLVLTLTADAGYTIGLSDEATLAMYDVPFSELLNPTGDPIGGGIGYSDIIDVGDADYVVDTAQELVDALSSATYGDIVYVEDDAEIDLTGYVADSYYNALFIPSGVTLASGRGNNGSLGGLIYTTDNWTNTNRVAMLGSGGDDVRVTGLRIQGPSGNKLEVSSDDNKYAIGVRCSGTGAAGSGNHKNIRVDNCEIYHWTMAAVYVMYGEDVSIDHNFLHTNIGDGYQYGIWFGASPDYDAEWAAEATANYFECNRHDIGSGCHWPWAARYNIFGPTKYQQVTDRHPGRSLDTWIENNWNQADASQDPSGNTIEFRVAFNSDGGGTVYYNNNWTTKTTVGPDTADPAIYAQVSSSYFDTVAANNTLSFDEYDDPYTPVAASTVTYLSTPLTVSFDSGDSYDPEGNDIVAHQWWFGDTTFGQGGTSLEANPTYTYSEAGVYEVTHYAFNDYGVAGVERFQVEVAPAAGGYWLSAWVWDDSSLGISEGTFVKQILLGENVIWSDDVSGDEGWQHVLVDVSAYATAGAGEVLTLQVVAGESPSGFTRVGFDNVAILGGDVGDSQMNQSGVWSVYDPGNWYTGANTAFAGQLGTTGGKLESWNKGGTARIYQTVSFGNPLPAMVTDNFESGDDTGGSGWDANWSLTGSAAVTSSGTPYDGSYHLLLTGSSAVASRAADLSDVVGDVSLKFQYKADSFEAGEEVSVEIYDGTQWQEVMVIEDGDDDGEYHLADIDLSGYSLTEDFQVRFTASLADAADFFYVDDLMIA